MEDSLVWIGRYARERREEDIMGEGGLHLFPRKKCTQYKFLSSLRLGATERGGTLLFLCANMSNSELLGVWAGDAAHWPGSGAAIVNYRPEQRGGHPEA